MEPVTVITDDNEVAEMDLFTNIARLWSFLSNTSLVWQNHEGGIEGSFHDGASA